MVRCAEFENSLLQLSIKILHFISQTINLQKLVKQVTVRCKIKLKLKLK